jgi:hypothetical protein
LELRDRELHDLKLNFIEPHPKLLRVRLKESNSNKTTIHRNAVQDAPIGAFSMLGKNDISLSTIPRNPPLTWTVTLLRDIGQPK